MVRVWVGVGMTGNIHTEAGPDGGNGKKTRGITINRYAMLWGAQLMEGTPHAWNKEGL